ncbi:hypothetical protein H5410_020496 [Solanum commersonii]|uniref:Uncharacterized protein n=1 Tax=Solanum commersonii TaxID=4109 RepID=A0A9J5ZBB1_SOLCO|nr:hypothetical protein H5410_020496 [Solanum commersonii]
MKPIGPEGQMDAFSSSNEPQSSPCIFCDPRFWLVFGRNFSWTSAKTLVMELVGPEGQIDAFSSSNDP